MLFFAESVKELVDTTTGPFSSAEYFEVAPASVFAFQVLPHRILSAHPDVRCTLTRPWAGPGAGHCRLAVQGWYDRSRKNPRMS